jgi:predicted membrane-bound spermidine synthase
VTYRQRLLYFFFFLSGFSGLIYESIWTHYLKLFLGHAAYAQSLVLAIFIGGMAIGAWWCGKASHRWRNLLVIYAVVEAGVGVMALCFHGVFNAVVDLSYDWVLPLAGEGSVVYLYKWTLAALLVLPQSILLGMTFPLMSGGMIRLFPSSSGGSISMLYFCNSLGGAIGVLGSGFILIRYLGLDGTVALAGGINILLAGLVGYLFLPYPKPVVGISKDRSQPQAQPVYRTLLVVALFTGLASFIYEIGWIRMLSLVLGSSTHSFELMLSAFIFGLAFGGLTVRRFIDKLAQPVLFLAKVQVLMGIAALLTLPLYGVTFEWMAWLMASLERRAENYWIYSLGSHALALLIMFPAAFLAGMTLPLITHSLMLKDYGEKAIGYVYAINTFGAIVGVLVAVHLGLPNLGLKGSIILAAAIDILLAIYLFWRFDEPRVRKMSIGFASAGLVAVVLVQTQVDLSVSKMASGVYRDGEILQSSQKVAYHRDGKTATISMTTESSVLSLRSNGKTDASINMAASGVPTFDEVTMTLIGAIPLMLKPDSRTVANIGFGSGMTGHVLLASEQLQHLDNIEIEPTVVQAAQMMRPFNERVFTDPRSEIHYEDAKSFFSTRNKRYDIIVSEPSNPWVSGIAGLFSQEFYSHIRRYLETDGIVAQWLQVYEFDMDLLVSVLKALAGQFEHILIVAVDHGDILILASDSPTLNADNLRKLPAGRLSADLARIGVKRIDDIRLRVVGGKEILAPLLATSAAPANSDFAPYVDQNAAQARFSDKSADQVLYAVVGLLPVRKLLQEWDINATHTQVTLTPMSPLSYPTYLSTYVRDQLLGMDTPKAMATDDYLSQRYSMVDQAINECRFGSRHGDRIYTLHQIVVRSLPFLNSDEMSRILDRLGEMPCGMNLDGYEGLWMDLYRAVNDGELGQVKTYAEKILVQEHRLTPARAEYLVGLGMIAYAAAGDGPGAEAFWQRFGPAWIDQKKEDFIYQFLLQFAQSRPEIRG